MLITDIYLGSGVCILLKTHMHEVPLDLISNVLLACDSVTYYRYKGVGENVTLRSYQKPLANMDQFVPNRMQGLS